MFSLKGVAMGTFNIDRKIYKLKKIQFCSSKSQVDDNILAKTEINEEPLSLI